MVGADAFIRESHRGFFAQKERAVICKVLQEKVVIAGVDFQVLGGVLVRQRGSFANLLPG